jgi:hypothetical protein
MSRSKFAETLFSIAAPLRRTVTSAGRGSRSRSTERPAAPSSPITIEVPSARSAQSRAPWAGATNGQASQALPARSAARSVLRSAARSPQSGRSQRRCVRSSRKVRQWGTGERTLPRRRNPRWWSSRPPTAGTRRRAESASQVSRCRAGGPDATAASGLRSQRTASAGVRHPSAASVKRLHSSIPSVPPSSSNAGHPCGSTIRRASDGISIRAPREKGCAAKPTPPASRTAVAISRAERPRCGISLSTPKAR